MSDSLTPQQRRRAEETRPNVEANDDSDDWENYDDDEDIDGEVATISLTNANCDDLPPEYPPPDFHLPIFTLCFLNRLINKKMRRFIGSR